MQALRATTDVVKQARGVVRNLTQIANEVGRSVEALANELTGLAKEVGLESLDAPQAADPVETPVVVDAEYVIEEKKESA